METGETGTEVLHILVSSTEDTTEDRSGREVTEPWTVVKGGSETDKETSEGTIWSRKVTLCHTQSINRLCRVNQSSPSTAGKSQSNLVNKNRRSWSFIGEIEEIGKWFEQAKCSSRKQGEEPQSRRELKERLGKCGMETWTKKEFGIRDLTAHK